MKCPYCEEEIQDGAIKCRFCKEMLAPSPDPGDQAIDPPDRVEPEVQPARPAFGAALLGKARALGHRKLELAYRPTPLHLAVIVILAGLAWWLLQPQPDPTDYQRAAAPVLRELLVMQAATGSGLDFEHYQAMLNDIGTKFKRFDEAYKGTSLASSQSFTCLTKAVRCYEMAAQHWERQNRASSDYEGLAKDESLLQKSWGDADVAIADAQRALARGK